MAADATLHVSTTQARSPLGVNHTVGGRCLPACGHRVAEFLLAAEITLSRLELPAMRARATYCFPIMRIENDPGTIGPRAGRPAGPGGASGAGGPYSAAIVKR